MRVVLLLIACLSCGARSDLGDKALADGGGVSLPTHTVHGRVHVRYSPDSVGVGLAFASTVGDAILTMAYADPIPQWSKSLTVEATGGSVHITRLLEWSEAMMTPIAIALPGQIAAISSRIAWLRPKYAPTGLLRYSVFIQDATAPGDPITLWTTDTSVTLPDAVLTTGHHYTARITAKWSAQSVTFSSHPLDGNITEQAWSSSDEFVF